MAGKVARILTIAGSDSGGGAGIQADIKTITMLGGHAMTAITAVTAQNTVGVDAVHKLPADIVMAQIDAVESDIGIDAIKIGMLGGADIAERLAVRLERVTVPIIFDPVMVATSGSQLADARTVASFQALMALSSVVTPNLPELNALGGVGPLIRHGCHLLIKGGHADGDVITDQLIGPNGKLREWRNPRIESKHTHGTGCTLASALATGMGQGMDAVSACERAIAFVRAGIKDAPGLGQGNGPLGYRRAVDIGAVDDWTK